ncbi:MAG: acyltransferase family protein [Opitutaceae bacterium]|nr:acyltransferase family protein [Opitutaceae bacterium]
MRPDASIRTHRSTTYIPALDGIRAIAIIAVLLFHVHPAALKGGFTGVDVFYVLSGFLITTIILQDLRHGRFSLTEFYIRRIQRLLPNMVLTVCVTLAVWSWVMMPSQILRTARHGLWALFNASNFYTWLYLGDYWSDAAEWAPLTHTWSLGVEEQFYLLYPTLLVLLAKYQPQRLRLWLTLAMIGSFAACTILTRIDQVAAFYLLPTRLWELLLGAVLAASARPSAALAPGVADPQPVSPATGRWNLCGYLGLALAVLGFVAIESGRDFPGVVALAPTVGTALLLLAATQPGTHVGHWLSTRFMVFTGKISYSLYLWHWPAIILGRYFAKSHGLSPVLGSIAGGIAGVGLAWAAYVGVEQPLRKRDAARRWRLITIGIGFIAVVVFAWNLSRRSAASDGGPVFNQPAFYGKLYDSDLRTSGNPTAAIRYSDVYFPPMESRADALWKTGGIVHLYGADRPQVVVLGSSHALMYSRLIDDICREHSISVAFLAAGGRSLFFDDFGADANRPSEPDPFDAARRQFLKEWRPEAIIAIDRWDSRFDQPAGFDGRLRAFLAEMCPLARRVIFIAQVPAAEVGENENLREVVGQMMKSSNSGLPPNLRPDPGEPLRRQAVATAEAMSREFPCLRVLRVDRLFYERDGSIRYAEGRDFYYADDDHLSELGADRTRPLFTEAILEAHSVPAPPR